MKTPHIEGKSVSLRPLNERDVPVMVRWVNDKRITQYLTMEPPISEEQEHTWVSGLEQSDIDLVFGIVNKETGMHIGNIGLHQINKDAGTSDVGLFIGEPDMQGKGYGAEALRLVVAYACNTLKLKIIHACIFSFNTRSISLFEESGFKRGEVIEKGYLKEGKWIEAVTYTYSCP